MNYLNKYAIIINKICDKTTLGKKMLQKLMYLIERKGVNLNLNYSIHLFGPYSSTLDNAIHVMEMKDIINIDTSGLTHKITMKDFEQLETELEQLEIENINFILDKFSNNTANELEALTTLDYVANEMLENQANDREIIDQVKKIKGNKYTTKYLESKLNILKEFGLLN